MKSSFKIFLDRGKTVLFKGKFTEYKTYDEIRKKIINTSQAPTFKSLKKALRERDFFTLEFGEDSPFIPTNLEEGIWDKRTYDYFLEKLRNRRLNDARYKFYVTKKPKKLTFKEIQYSEVLQKSLEETWKPIVNDLKKDLNLLTLEEAKTQFDEKKKEAENNDEKLKMEKHKGFLCCNCFEKDFDGPRFVCSECDNYNLCNNCEKLLKKEQIHDREHVLIQVNKPTDSNEAFMFNNFFGPKEITNQFAENCFDIKFTVINTGENDLDKCYILPVRYGENYLGCKPYVIEEKLGRNERKEIDLRIRRESDLTRGIFDGYFRMFTPNGMPFGNVLHVQNIVGE